MYQPLQDLNEDSDTPKEETPPLNEEWLNDPTFVPEGTQLNLNSIKLPNEEGLSADFYTEGTSMIIELKDPNDKILNTFVFQHQNQTLNLDEPGESLYFIRWRVEVRVGKEETGIGFLIKRKVENYVPYEQYQQQRGEWRPQRNRKGPSWMDNYSVHIHPHPEHGPEFKLEWDQLIPHEWKISLRKDQQLLIYRLRRTEEGQLNWECLNAKPALYIFNITANQKNNKHHINVNIRPNRNHPHWKFLYKK